MESESGTKMNTINSEMNWVLQTSLRGKVGDMLYRDENHTESKNDKI